MGTMSAVSGQTVHIAASLEAEECIRRHGGSVYIWPSHHRCCGGGLTLLATSTERPPNRAFEQYAGRGFAVFLEVSLCDRTGEIELGLHGFRRTRIEAYWNGCVYII